MQDLEFILFYFVYLYKEISAHVPHLNTNKVSKILEMGVCYQEISALPYSVYESADNFSLRFSVALLFS